MSIYSNAVLSLNPSSYWRFTGATPLGDSGTGGITLTAVGSPRRVPSIIPGELNESDSAYDLNGSSMYFTGGDNYQFDGVFGTQKFTLAWWFQLHSSTMGSGFQRVLEKQSVATTVGWSLIGANTPADLFIAFDQGATDENTTADTNFVNGTTAFVVMTWDSSIPSLNTYVNGVQIAFDITGWTLAIPDTTGINLSIGARNTGANPFNGIMDDVAIWDGVALTAAQILNLWTVGSTVAPEQHARPAMTSRGVGW